MKPSHRAYIITFSRLTNCSDNHGIPTTFTLHHGSQQVYKIWVTAVRVETEWRQSHLLNSIKFIISKDFGVIINYFINAFCTSSICWSANTNKRFVTKDFFDDRGTPLTRGTSHIFNQPVIKVFSNSCQRFIFFT